MSGIALDQNSFGPVAGVQVFAYHGRPYTFHEILAWAQFTGRLETITAHLRRTERALLATSEVTPEHVQQAVTDLRYRHNLITAEETEAWMAQRGLSRDELYRHIYRTFCTDPQAMALSEDEWFQSVPDSFREFWAELHLSGQFDVLVEEFIFRAAAQALNPPEEARAESLKLNVSHLAKQLMGPYFGTSRSLEGAFVEFAETTAGSESCARRLKSHRMELLMVEFQALTYPSQTASREAYSCIVFDKEDPYALADRTGVLVRSGASFVEDLPEDLGRHLLSAQPGECLAPIQLPSQEGYTVCRLLAKIEPSLSSPAVATRVKRRIVSEALGEEIEKNLRWLPWQRSDPA